MEPPRHLFFFLIPCNIFFNPLLVNVSQRCSVSICLFIFVYLPGTSSFYSFKSCLFSQTWYKASFSINFFNFSTLLPVNHTLLWNYFWILPIPCGRDSKHSIAQYFPKCSLNSPVWNGISKVKWFWKMLHILSHC